MLGSMNAGRSQRETAGHATALLLSLTAMILFLQGCVVEELSFVSYTSSAEVKPSETQPTAVVTSSPFPWDVVLRGASDILTGARKKAIEEKVGYREARSFILFQLKTGKGSRVPCNKEDVQPGDHTIGKTDK